MSRDDAWSQQTRESPSFDRLSQRAQLGQLMSIPLLAEGHPAAVAMMVAESSVLRFDDGEEIVSVGRRTDALFGVLHGQATMSLPELSTPAVFSEGDLFGEAVLFPVEHWRTSVLAMGSVELLCVPQHALQLAVSHDHALGDLLFNLLTRRVLDLVEQTSPLFTDLARPARRRLLARFEVRHIESGTCLQRPQSSSTGAWVPVTGWLELGDDSIVPPGHTVGHQPLLQGRPAQQSLRSGPDMIALRYPPKAVQELLDTYSSEVGYRASE